MPSAVFKAFCSEVYLFSHRLLVLMRLIENAEQETLCGSCSAYLNLLQSLGVFAKYQTLRFRLLLQCRIILVYPSCLP